MKYRLVELLQCPGCQGELEMAGAEHRVDAKTSGPIFRCQHYCALERHSTIPGPETCAECGRTEIVSGTLACLGCGQKFRIVESVPWLFHEQSLEANSRLSDTAALYSHIWKGSTLSTSHDPVHIDGVEEAIGRPVVQGTVGLDAGSGSGADTFAMASRHPSVEVISLDMSEGVYATRQRTEGMPNVHVIRGSVLSLPLKGGICDFGYSFGVLHHTTDPLRGLKEITRVLKAGGRASLYLYEDHSDNPWKAVPLMVVSLIRQLTINLPTRVLSGLCYLLSPFVVLAFSIPARILSRFPQTRALAEQIPFNFGTSLFSVHDDLMDRFGAPIELRYSDQQIHALLGACCLSKIRTAKLKAAAGWVAGGVKSHV